MHDSMLRFVRTLVLGLLAACAGLAQAHKASDAYLQLSSGDAGTTLRVDVALRDLDAALDLDRDGDGKLTWREVQAAWPAIEGYVQARVELQACPLQSTGRSLEKRADGVYAALMFGSECSPADPPAVRYGVMEGVDATHRGIARIDWRGHPTALSLLSPQRFGAASSSPEPDSRQTTMPSPVGKAAPRPEPAWSFVREGVLHILTGYDHVLFLVCLLLPAAVHRTKAGWQPVQRWRQALLPVAGIVTAFTLAHSVSLALAATETVLLPPSLIEPAIAATIILAALDNLWPVFRGRRAAVTFFFGLIHGFGFASVLGELDLPPAAFAWSLLQFNVGIELGQLAIVAAATALLFLLRHRPAYPVVFIRAGSVLSMLVASVWLTERIGNLSLLPVL